MLADFQQSGAVMIRRRLDRKFPEQFAIHAEGYLSSMEKGYARPNTVLSHRKTLYRFTDFLDSRGVCSCSGITLGHINSYIEAAQLFQRQRPLLLRDYPQVPEISVRKRRGQ